MIWENYIGTEFLVSKKTCEDIINLGEEKINKGFGEHVSNSFRNDIALPFSNFGSYIRSPLFEEVNLAIEKSLKEFLNKFTLNSSSKFYNYPHHKFQKSISDGGFTDWHTECTSKHNKRAFVWMLYLNTVNNGGKTEFYKTKDEIIRVKPEAGKFVFWPAAETHFHRAAPDLKETKYILTGWVCRK